MSYTQKEIIDLVRPTKVHRKVYTDPEVFDLEMERLWAKTWIYIGHASQVQDKGSYITLNYGKVPVVMVRDTDMKVHVLHNRCGHKGVKLVDKACGKIPAFRCCYHGWRYRLDGKLLGVPYMESYEDTAFNKEDPQYSMQKLRSDSVRGFVFATMNADAPDLRTWMGGAADVMENLCDRAPDGEVEAAGGVLRYEHECNWKMFIENLNDMMHPMVVHRSVVECARDYIKTLPPDSPRLDEAEILLPFGASYEVMNDSITGFKYGHHYDGGKTSIHADYTLDPEYAAAMKSAYGEARMNEILSFNTHNTLYYPSLTIKSAIQNIRVVRPIAYNKTIIETWSFRLKGAPDSMLKKTLLYSRLINSNGSMVGPDDLTAYFRAQQGLESEASDWIEMHRHFGKDEVLTDRVIGKGTSDLDVRTQYTAWREYMTEAA